MGTLRQFTPSYKSLIFSNLLPKRQKAMYDPEPSGLLAFSRPTKTVRPKKNGSPQSNDVASVFVPARSPTAYPVLVFTFPTLKLTVALVPAADPEATVVAMVADSLNTEVGQ